MRSSLALSLVTGRRVRIEKIRAGRKKPGLLRQHLTAVEAAAAVGRATVSGAELGSRELLFEPTTIEPGDYRFAVGTAGSATLVLQAILPALLTAPRASKLILEGGTHNPFAPPFDFLERAFLPSLRRMGARVEVSLERAGFYPAGGGLFQATIEPATWTPLELLERGRLRKKTARALIANLPRSIAERELRSVRDLLTWDRKELRVEEVDGAVGPGNVLLLEVASEHVTEIFAGFGERGVPAQSVAKQAARAARRYLAAGVPVGEHLADQLLVPMALAGGGVFRTLAPSRHLHTNIDVLKAFLDVRVEVIEEARDQFRVEIQPEDA